MLLRSIVNLQYCELFLPFSKVIQLDIHSFFIFFHGLSRILISDLWCMYVYMYKWYIFHIWYMFTLSDTPDAYRQEKLMNKPEKQYMCIKVTQMCGDAHRFVYGIYIYMMVSTTIYHYCQFYVNSCHLFNWLQSRLALPLSHTFIGDKRVLSLRQWSIHITIDRLACVCLKSMELTPLVNCSFSLSTSLFNVMISRPICVAARWHYFVTWLE